MPINTINNTACICFDCTAICSNTVETALLRTPTIVKEVNRSETHIGDTLEYTITITNPGGAAIVNLPFTDMLQDGITYVDGSFTVNGVPQTPTLTGNILSYIIPSIPAGGTVVIKFQALVVG